MADTSESTPIVDLVVAGHDGSDEAATAVRWAAQIAQRN